MPWSTRPEYFWGALVCWQIDFLVFSGSQADLRALDNIVLKLRAIDNIVLACTSDNSVRVAFSSRKVFIVLDLRSHYESDLLKHRFELKGPILTRRRANRCADQISETPWAGPSHTRVRNRLFSCSGCSGAASPKSLLLAFNGCVGQTQI